MLKFSAHISIVSSTDNRCLTLAMPWLHSSMANSDACRSNPLEVGKAFCACRSAVFRILKCGNTTKDLPDIFFAASASAFTLASGESAVLAPVAISALACCNRLVIDLAAPSAALNNANPTVSP